MMCMKSAKSKRDIWWLKTYSTCQYLDAIQLLFRMWKYDHIPLKKGVEVPQAFLRHTVSYDVAPDCWKWPIVSVWCHLYLCSMFLQCSNRGLSQNLTNPRSQTVEVGACKVKLSHHSLLWLTN